MRAQMGWQGFEHRLRREAAQWTHLLPQLPRLLHQALTDTGRDDRLLAEVRRLRQETQRRNRLLLVGVTCLGAIVIMFAWMFIGMPLPGR